MSRREAREERKRLKLLKFEASRDALIAKVPSSGLPRIATTPPADPAPRVDPALEPDPDPPRLPKAVAAESRFASLVTWCTTRHDQKWVWQDVRCWTDEEWTDVIHPSFREFERLTWAEIDRQVYGKKNRHKLHHLQEVSRLAPDAQKRWLKLKLEEFDTAFRFRIGGTRRVWGFILGAHFHIVWWDPEHDIYPVEPK